MSTLIQSLQAQHRHYRHLYAKSGRTTILHRTLGANTSNAKFSPQSPSAQTLLVRVCLSQPPSFRTSRVRDETHSSLIPAHLKAHWDIADFVNFARRLQAFVGPLEVFLISLDALRTFTFSIVWDTWLRNMCVAAAVWQEHGGSEWVYLVESFVLLRLYQVP